MTHDRVVGADAVVVGTGVAGLTTALSMPSLDVALVTKTELGGGSTWWAQGGIAAPVAPEDSPTLHAGDTIAVGGGLNDPNAVDTLTAGAAVGIEHLVERGARFDLADDGRPALSREAGHSVRRILHAHGDATGAEVSRALVAATGNANNIVLHEKTFACDLLLDGEGVAGVVAETDGGERVSFVSGAVVLATGGIGRVFENTTNPPEVTGDGMAMAARAGARIADAEFVQFHPTALDAGRDPMPLLTEALRGEGAVLVDDSGERIMISVHPDAELASRDVVARAVWQRAIEGSKVYLDAREAVGRAFPERFPTVFGLCVDVGLDPRVDLIPVAPAAHYHMGGIAVDLNGRSSLPGLWAVGEASRSGVHGANRLASNSLLEGLVFGEAVGADIMRRERKPRPLPEVNGVRRSDSAQDETNHLRRLMWEKVGLVRNEAGLTEALVAIEAITGHLPPGPSELRNMAEVSRIVASAALARTESRGAHFRSDYPHPDETYLVR